MRAAVKVCLVTIAISALAGACGVPAPGWSFRWVRDPFILDEFGEFNCTVLVTTDPTADRATIKIVTAGTVRNVALRVTLNGGSPVTLPAPQLVLPETPYQEWVIYFGERGDLCRRDGQNVLKAELFNDGVFVASDSITG